MKNYLLLMIALLGVLWANAQDVSGNITNVNCGEGADGAIDITVTGGSGQYTYEWSGPNSFSSTDEDIINLIAGAYSVTVTDVGAKSLNSINTTEEYIVTEPSLFELDFQHTNISCVGANDGSIDLTVLQGGTPPYSYLWSNGATTEDLSGLTIDEMGYGEYWVTVSDVNGCQEYGGDMINDAMDIYFSLNITNSNCGNADGMATVEELEGSPDDYEITWVTGQTGLTADNLAAGIYSVQVQLISLGCSKTEYFFVEDAGGAVITPQVLDASSPTTNDGQITLDITGGQAPYLVGWSNAMLGVVNPNLYPGSYSATVTDANGCINRVCVSVSNNSELWAYPNSTNTSSCISSDGSATVNVGGGTPPYAYVWDDAANQTTATASNLSAGIYHCAVTDASLISKTVTIAVGNTGGPNVILEDAGSTICGLDNGYLNIGVSGGAGSYNYLWSNGATTQDLSSVSAGNYSLIVNDGTCSTSYNGYIGSIMLQEQPICMVTVDSTTDHNFVVWENVQDVGVDHYNVYRLGCDQNYGLIGSVNADAVSVFEDISSLPFIQSYSYQITAVDACGNESNRSNFHKTIHLEINLDEANHQAQLIWDDYIGFPNPIFKLYKKTTDQGWVLLSDVPNTDLSFTDFQYNDTTISYAIIVEKPDGNCDAWNGVSHASGGPYYQSSSNLEDEGIINHTGVENMGNLLSIYPNPAHRVLNVKSQDLISTIRIFDISGKLIVTYQNVNQKNVKINTQNFESGVYILEVQSSELTKERIVIE